MYSVLIGEREVGLGHAPYVIAEIGVNHDGDADKAMLLCDAAADAGADAVKLQYFETDRLMSKAAKLAAYQKAAGETDPVAMLRRLELSLDDCARVIERAHARGLHAIVTVFSLETVDAALALPWDALKTASPDIVNYPLLRALMADGRPMIVSTGAASWCEVMSAMSEVFNTGSQPIGMLHCVSSYPTPRERASIAGVHSLPADVHARMGATGYSDHTSELDTGALAMRLGASILEKHLTYDRDAFGPDHSASLDPDAMAAYVQNVRSQSVLTVDEFFDIPFPDDDPGYWDALMAEPAFGPRQKQVQQIELDVRRVSRQSLVATRDIKAGEVITSDMLTVKRPCDSDHVFAANLDAVVGQRAPLPVEFDMPLPREAVDEMADACVAWPEVQPWWAPYEDAAAYPDPSPVPNASADPKQFLGVDS